MKILAPKKHNLPPGPSTFELWGDAPTESNQLLLDYPLSLMPKYGDIIRFPSSPREPMIYVMNPDVIDKILKKSRDIYIKDNKAYRSFWPTIGYSMLTSDKEDWQHARQHVQPAFHRQHLDSYFPMIVNCAQQATTRWLHIANNARVIDVHKEMALLTIDMVSQALLSTPLGEQKFPLLHFIERLNQQSHHRYPRFIPTLDNIEYMYTRWRTHRIVNKIIKEHKSPEYPDVIDLLSNPKTPRPQTRPLHEELRDEIKTMLVLGHESSACALSWFWLHLDQNPEYLARVLEEIETVVGQRPIELADLPNLVFTKAMLEEVLRFYPTAWQTTRKNTEPDEIGPYDIPANSIIGLHFYGLQRHPDHWENPNTFDPERFLPGRKEKINKAAYLPFGTGPRVCIGSQLSFMQSLVIITTLLQKFRLVDVSIKPVTPWALVSLRTPKHFRMEIRKVIKMNTK